MQYAATTNNLVQLTLLNDRWFRLLARLRHVRIKLQDTQTEHGEITASGSKIEREIQINVWVVSEWKIKVY